MLRRRSHKSCLRARINVSRLGKELPFFESFVDRRRELTFSNPTHEGSKREHKVGVDRQVGICSRTIFFSFQWPRKRRIKKGIAFAF